MNNLLKSFLAALLAAAIGCAQAQNGLDISTKQLPGGTSTGTWNGNVITPPYGGTGIANGVSSTLTLTGANAFTRADYFKTAPAIAAGVLTLNLNLSNFFVIALNANITTMTVSNWAASGTASSFTLITRGDGTPRTISWVAGGVWENNGGAAPTPTSTSGKCDRYFLYGYNGGTSPIISLQAQNFTCPA